MASLDFNRLWLALIAVTLPVLLVLLSADVQADTEQARNNGAWHRIWDKSFRVHQRDAAAGRCRSEAAAHPPQRVDCPTVQPTSSREECHARCFRDDTLMPCERLHEDSEDRHQLDWQGVD